MEQSNRKKKRKLKEIDDIKTKKRNLEKMDIDEPGLKSAKKLKLNNDSKSGEFQVDDFSGDVEQRSSVDVMRFLKARKNELKFLTSAIETKLPKRIIQQLPRHMRRRAASHNPKRLPRRVRERAMKELEKVKKTKRPSRKYRRKPRNLLEEYNRRQKNHIWLETHIWFAKRFKMIEIWGYKLAYQSNDKCVKALYRSTINHALLQDISYYGCIELSGKEEILLQQLSQLTNPDLGLTFGSKLYLNGSREGTVFLFHQNSYPYGIIGPVKFFWKPQINFKSSTEEMRYIWLWVHPSCIKELIDELINLFNLQQKIQNNISEATCDSKRKLYFERISIYSSNDITLTILKDVLVRHRLVGPQSQSVITNSLQQTLIDPDPEVSNETSNWWENFPKSKVFMDLQKIQQFTWKKLNNSSVKLLPGTIIGTTVKDPRVSLPSKKVPSHLNDDCCNEEIVPTPELAYSHIWDSSIRDEVSFKKIPQAKLNEMRSNNSLNFNTTLEELSNKSRIPLLIIFQSGNENDYGNGLDVIIPGGWSMAFWIAFIYQGAKASGLRETKNIGLESGLPVFPFNFPDSQSCKEIQEKRRLELTAKHYRYPPDKRPSFEKLGIQTPFFYPWLELVQEWKRDFSQTANISLIKNDFFVLREKRCLKLLIHLFTSNRNRKETKSIKNSEISVKTFSNFFVNEKNYFQNALICVQLTPVFKGTPDEFSTIFLPLEMDFKEYKLNLHHEGPIEPVHHTENKTKNKKTKGNKATKSEQLEMKLSKPEIKNLLLSSTRKIIGYVEYGNYSFIGGRSAAMGHCTLKGIVELLQKCLEQETEPIALVKNQNSYQFRYVKIKIVV
ncbi:ribonucleases P/MRP protein subunit POP1-like [Centruroides sculpturatus]|uniref:ribonucleases P/MRP protein subunit POP1-like n=1 Tax=Centruroides sculpturatus TaxID=218467 RepID=UPI000C6D9EE4|nr:ribonucleases P/MRP protein subunit POP1-like [Centruroides sculpturatus]